MTVTLSSDEPRGQMAHGHSDRLTRSLDDSDGYENHLQSDSIRRNSSLGLSHSLSNNNVDGGTGFDVSSWKPPPRSRPASWRRFLDGVTVEPAIFFHILVISMETTVLANLVLHKICANNLHLPDSLCLYNMSNATVQEEVQVQAANLEMYISLANTLPSFLIAIFMGAYSDRRGRKFPIVFPVVGCIFTSVLFAVFAHYDQMPPTFLCVAVVPRAIGGGLIAFNSSCLSYVSDKSTPEKRTERVAMVEASLFLGTPVGTLLGGYLADSNFMVAFIIGCVVDVFVVVYLVLVIQDPPSPPGSSTGFWREVKEFFDVRNVKLTLSTVFKRREGNDRMYVMLMLVAMFPGLIAFIGTSSIMYLFVRLLFSWDILTYSYYSVATIVAVAVGLILSSIVLVRVLKVSDPVLAICGGFCGIAHNVLVALSSNTMQLYLAIIPGAFSATSMLSIRSMLSKLIPADEQGKVFSVSASVDAAVPLFTSVVYTQLYTATLTYFPQSCFVLSASILFIPIVIMSYVHYDTKVRNGRPKSGYIRIASSD